MNKVSMWILILLTEAVLPFRQGVTSRYIPTLPINKISLAVFAGKMWLEE